MTDSSGNPPYRPSSVLGTLASLAILATGVFSAVATLTNGYGRATYPAWDDLDAEVSGDAEGLLLLLGGLAWAAMLLTLLLAIVIFCVWLYRVARNARALGVRFLETTPGWAVGYFFVPFVNLVRPYWAVKEIWQSSDPEAEPDHWSHRPCTLVTYWWGFWVFGNLGSSALNPFFKGERSMSVVMTVAAVQSAQWLIAAVLATLVIRGIVRRQNAKASVQREGAIASTS